MKAVRIALLCITLSSAASCFFDRERIASSRRRLQTLTSSPEDPTATANFQSMKVPTSIYELSSPVDYATQGGQTAAPAALAGVINIGLMNHDANYIKIADDLKRYEDAYSDCINVLSENDFSDETVEACVGINYNYVYDDIDYEKSKLLARADSAVRDFLIQNCYTVAGVDLVMSNACDLVESDAINLLWNELNFAALLDYHRNKYLFEHAFLQEGVFNTIVEQFKTIWNETSSLLTELYDHRRLTVTHLEDLISRRTSEILEKYQTSSASNFQSISIHISGGEDADWVKKHRGLAGQKPAGAAGNYKPPMARFLELNPKNLKVRSDKQAQQGPAEAAPKNAKIVVDGQAPGDKPAV